MDRNHFEIVADGANALAVKVSRKPRAPEEEIFSPAGGKILVDTFL